MAIPIKRLDVIFLVYKLLILFPLFLGETKTSLKPSLKTDEWIKKMWYIYTMDYDSAIKMNEIGSFVETWMDLETVIQSEVSQKEKNKYRLLMHICGT